MAIGGEGERRIGGSRDPAYGEYLSKYPGYSGPSVFGFLPPEGAMGYREWQALRSSLTPPGGGSTTPPVTPPVTPPSGGGGNDQQGCINGICPMPGLPPYSQPPANWQQQLPGMSGNPMGPLYNYDPSFGLGLGTQAAGIPNWQNMLAQLFQQYNPPQ